LALTEIVDAFIAGSESIFPCIAVTIASSDGLALFPQPVAITSTALQSIAINRSLTTAKPLL
jgi:hypothetical protein